MFVTTKIEVKSYQLACAFVGCFESGASEWLGLANAPKCGEDKTYDENFAFEIHYTGDDDEEGDFNSKMVIDNEKVEAGLKIMAEKHSEHFSALIKDEDDAITHDVLLQCIVFGDVIYG